MYQKVARFDPLEHIWKDITTLFAMDNFWFTVTRLQGTNIIRSANTSPYDVDVTLFDAQGKKFEFAVSKRGSYEGDRKMDKIAKFIVNSYERTTNEGEPEFRGTFKYACRFTLPASEEDREARQRAEYVRNDALEPEYYQALTVDHLVDLYNNKGFIVILAPPGGTPDSANAEVHVVKEIAEVRKLCDGRTYGDTKVMSYFEVYGKDDR